MKTNLKIIAHALVKNESRWIWYSLMSVLDVVDEIMVWDTGSTDNTVEIIKSIKNPKIKFKQVELGNDPLAHTQLRQRMLEETTGDWLMILDGDEVWWQQNLIEVKSEITKNPAKLAIVSPVLNCVGDIFHFQNPKYSKYEILGYKGAFNIRFINLKISGLHISKPHGGQEYRDSTETAIQNFPPEKLLYVDQPYIHTTHLPRSSNLKIDKTTLKRNFKYRYELGNSIEEDFTYPEVFYLPKQINVNTPFFHRSCSYVFRALAIEPVRLIKNMFYSRSGY